MTAFHMILETGFRLRPAQIGYWVWRRMIQDRIRKTPILERQFPLEGEWTFRFMNREQVFYAGEFTWHPAGMPRLWRYNLHYFNYLHSPGLTDAEKSILIEHWVKANPIGAGAGWEPYPTSLRLVNWCRWFLLRGESVLRDSLAFSRESIEQQAIWLSRRLELHILANHYFENLKALIFVNAALDGALSSRLIRKVRRGFLEQLDEQFLEDGGHYERSPSYHSLLTDGLLDLLELGQLRPQHMDPVVLDKVRHRARLAIELLSNIELPGDRYPLFNDSAFDSAPWPSQIYTRARQLGLNWEHAAADRVIEYPHFGIFGLHNDTGDALAIKCGAVGPDYQPGHTHCDMLSFEWYVGGKPVVVDTGVYEYEPGATRRYVRSTAAHNTVSVDDAEQSEIWGEFRVGRRARIINTELEALADGIRFDGEIKAFPQRGWVRHRRRISARKDAAAARLTIDDDIQGRGQGCLRSRVLFHPDIDVVHQTDRELKLCRDGVPVGELIVGEDLEVEIVGAPYCPEFGLRLEAKQVILRRTSALPARLHYSLRIDRTGPSTISQNP